MSFVATEEDAVVAAERKLLARARTVRLDWQRVQASSREALTAPTVIGGVALAGAMLAGRSRPSKDVVECKCIKSSPSFLRAVFLAVVTPLIQDAMVRWLATFSGREATSFPGAPPSVGEPTRLGESPS